MYKTERFEMRLTEKEAQMLDAVRGSATRAAWLRNQIMRASQAVSEEVSVTDTPPDTAQVHDLSEFAPIQASHRHRRGKVVSTRTGFQGAIINTYACTEAGCTWTVEGS